MSAAYDKRVVVWLTDHVTVEATLIGGSPTPFWHRVQFDGPVDLPPQFEVTLANDESQL